MATLTDYLDTELLTRLEDVFTLAAGAPVRILDQDAQAMGRPVSACEKASRTRITADGLAVGYITVDRGSERTDSTTQPAESQLLMAELIGRLCSRRKKLRGRVDELVTLFRLTAEFAGQRDLDSLLELIAQTVVDVMGVKACSIRLLNSEQTELLIRAVAGLSQTYLDKGPILLEDSLIDTEVLSTRKPVYIADERTDPRVLYPAEARNEGLVSALCAPLMYKGRAEGIIRVYTSQLHEFDWFEVSLLQSIASVAAAAIVNARLYAEAVAAANMRRHLRLAGEVQRRMIPSEPPQIAGFDIGMVYVPCFELGGDFYDFIELSPDNLGMAVCDVVGKGVRASLLTASLRASLRAHAQGVYDMPNLLSRVNRDMCADTLSGDFATLFYGVLDHKSRRLTYTNAGHPPPILCRAGRTNALNVSGPVIGVDSAYTWKHESFAMRSGDVLLGFTDGLLEAMNFDDETFGRHRAEQAALAAVEAGRPAAGIANDVLWEMRRFAGLQKRLDDLTMIVIKVL